MRIWQKPISLEDLIASNVDTASSHLGIEYLEIGDDYLTGRVPVDARTRQPYGLLHGGVSVVLAETLGSMGAYYACPEGHRAVGLDRGPLVFSAITGGTQNQHWCGGGVGRSLISLAFLFTFQTGIVTPH